MRTNKILFWTLVILVLAIWGAIAYQVFTALTESDADLVLEVPWAPEQRRDVLGYVYKDDVRDPFQFGVPVRRDTVKRAAAPQMEVWLPPPFRLTGIVVTTKKKTAMIERNDGEVYFLQEGDTVNGLRIMKIQPHTVSYSYGKKKSLWGLDSVQQ